MKQKVLDLVNLFTGLRKTIIMLVLIAICIGFRIANLMSGENMVELLKNTVIAYFGANSVEHFSAMVKEHLISKQMPTSVAGAVQEGEDVVSDIAAETVKGG